MLTVITNDEEAHIYCIRNIISPRAGASSCLFGRKMFIFGGTCNGVFYSDLHSIDIDDFSVQTYDCDGDAPCQRAGAVMFYESDSILIWGGFDGKTYGAVHTQGRTSPAYCCFKGMYYVFGSSKTNGLLVIFI
jgi:hypothetical protein